MALLSLPAELLEVIASNALPEGFESLTLSCQTFHAVCTPLLARYQALRHLFDEFEYGFNDKVRETRPSCTLNFLKWIADDPIIPRYIRKANLRDDCSDLSFHLGEIDLGGALANLFAESNSIKYAELDWKEYYHHVWKDAQAHRYSQWGMVFFLSLLPNVEDLTLPIRWEPGRDASSRLLEATILNARLANATQSTARPGLASVSSIRMHGTTLDCAVPFLSLPILRCFEGGFIRPLQDDLESMPSKHIYETFGRTLEDLRLHAIGLDAHSFGELLKRTPQLKTLHLSPSTNSFEVSALIDTAGREVGTHLQELKVEFNLPAWHIIEHVSFRRFRCLRRLTYPSEILVSNRTRMLATRQTLSEAKEAMEHPPTVAQVERAPWVCDLIPSSVTELHHVMRSALRLPGVHWRHIEEILDLVITDKVSKLSKVTKILMQVFKGDDDDAFGEWYRRMLQHAEVAGVEVIFQFACEEINLCSEAELEQQGIYTPQAIKSLERSRDRATKLLWREHGGV